MAVIHSEKYKEYDWERSNCLLRNVIDFILKNVKPGNAKRMSQAQIALDLGCSRSQVSKVLTGRGYKHNAHKKAICEMLDDLQRIYHLAYHDDDSCRFKAEIDETIDLNRLADKLLLNYIDIAVDFNEKDTFHKKVLNPDNDVLSARQAKEERERIIFIIGDDASSVISSGVLPSKQEMATMIYADLAAEEGFKKRYQDEIMRLKYVYRLSADDPETKLLALSSLNRKKLIEKLKEIFGFSNYPSFEYEVLGHMYKHHLCDAIINYAYDEILDRAIEEEMNGSDNLFIFSDAQVPVPLESQMTRNRLKHPLYIRPNGNISKVSTLKITSRDKFSLSREFAEFMSWLFKGDISGFKYKQKYLSLNLVMFGFNDIHDVEFIDYLKEYFAVNANRQLNIWNFNPVEINLNRLSEEIGVSSSKINLHSFLSNGYRDYLEKIWDRIDQNICDQHTRVDETSPECDTPVNTISYQAYKPKGINRHQLINLALSISDEEQRKLLQGDKALIKAYYKARLYLEVILAFLKSDGVVNHVNFRESRVYKYYSLYAATTESPRHISDLCKDLGLVRYKEFSWDAYWYEEPNLFYDKEKIVQELYDKLVSKKLNGDFFNHIKGQEEQEQKLIVMLQNISGTNALDVAPNSSYIHSNVFHSIKDENLLLTSLKWVKKFREFTEDKTDDWDLMLAVSEKGRFLSESLIQTLNKDKKLEIVLASFDHKSLPDLKEDSALHKIDNSTLISKDFQYLPWWLHNRHLIILLKQKNVHSNIAFRKWKQVAVFYYQSLNMSRKINPIFTQDMKDMKLITNIFINDWWNSQMYRRSNNGGNQYFPKSQQEMQQQYNSLFPDHFLNCQDELNEVANLLLVKAYNESVQWS